MEKEMIIAVNEESAEIFKEFAKKMIIYIALNIKHLSD